MALDEKCLKRLDEILAQYKVDLDTSRFKKDKKNATWWEKEKYKWEAVKTFQDNWNIEAEDFADMLKRALSKTKNLLQSRNMLAGSVIRTFAKKAPEETRAMFRDLFDESTDFVARVETFKGKSKELYDQYGPANGMDHQGENAITTYLWLRYPDKYYIYKQSVAEALAKNLGYGYDFPRGAQAENLRRFFDFYNEICGYIKADTGLINLLKSHLTDSCYADPECKTFVTDLGVYVKNGIGTPPPPPPPPPSQNYWWLVANPDIWSMSDLEEGKTEFYTLYNGEQQRQIFQNYLDAKVGEPVIGYESGSVQKVVATFEVAAAQDGEKIVFKKIKNAKYHAKRAELQARPELKDMEFFKRGNGSLFKLTEKEYKCIEKIINNPSGTGKYTREDFLREVFMTKDKYEELKDVLEQKKNIILNGVPGVGKTFAAERLAYSIIGKKDNNRIKLIQFHQNYSYEDFIQGYKPEEGGGFKLEPGVFYEFCKEAAKHKDEGPYFFIIDEINRGNMSKIFGELLMIIEYRDKEVVLAYDKEKFSVPDNLRIIGTMNTTDRSIAMLDYALRRRFAHFELNPAFGTEEFKNWLNETGNGDNQDLHDLIKIIIAMNKKIAKSLGKGFRIGHSYFCENKIYSSEDLRVIVNYEIIPAIEEYWFDEQKKVALWSGILRKEKPLSDADKDEYIDEDEEEDTEANTDNGEENIGQ